MGKIKSTLLGLLSGLVLLGASAKPAKAINPGFDGNTWRGSYPIPANGANITLFNPRGPDTVMARVDNTGYWARAPPPSWNLQLLDTIKIKIKDTNGDSARTYRVITFNGNNSVVDIYPNGHSLLVPFVKDGSVDSVDAKCFVKSKQDTLNGRFGRHSYPFDVSFNAPNFPLRSRPVYGDSVVFLISHSGYQTARTALQYKNEFWDADTAASCSLQASGVEREPVNIERIINDLIASPNPTKGHIRFNREFKGILYDLNGRRVRDVNGKEIEMNNLPSGTYFLIEKQNEKLESDYNKHTNKIVLTK